MHYDLRVFLVVCLLSRYIPVEIAYCLNEDHLTLVHFNFNLLFGKMRVYGTSTSSAFLRPSTAKSERLTMKLAGDHPIVAIESRMKSAGEECGSGVKCPGKICRNGCFCKIMGKSSQ